MYLPLIKLAVNELAINAIPNEVGIKINLVIKYCPSGNKYINFPAENIS